MTFLRWNPFRNLNWQPPFFDDYFEPLACGCNTAERFMPVVDAIENEEEYTLKVELPGMGKKDIKVDIDGDVLTISGEHRSEERKAGESMLIAERHYGPFARKIRLPNAADLAKADAQHADGVLTIRLPKKEEAKPYKKELTIT